MSEELDPRALLKNASRALSESRFQEASREARAARAAFEQAGDHIGSALALGFDAAAQGGQGQGTEAVDRMNAATLQLDQARSLAEEQRQAREKLEGELHLAREEIGRLAMLDPLTGCYNRRYLERCLIREYRRARRHGAPFSIAVMEVDDFDAIGSDQSSAMVDYLLALVAEIISGRIRTEDVLARFGGERFVVLLPDTDLAGAIRACEKIRQGVADHPWETAGESLEVTLSVGVASALDTNDHQELLTHAETALETARQRGRNRVEPALALAGAQSNEPVEND